MAKLRNSIKILIVALSLVVVTTGVVLGVVLTRKDKPTNSPVAEGYQLTEAQKKFGEALNATLENNVVESGFFDINKLKLSETESVDLNKVSYVCENYFVTLFDENLDSEAYIYQSNGYVKPMFELLNLDFNKTLSYWVSCWLDNYFVVNWMYEQDSQCITNLYIVELRSYNVQILRTYTFESENKDAQFFSYGNIEFDWSSVCVDLKDNFYALTFDGKDGNYYIELSLYKSEVIKDIDYVFIEDFDNVNDIFKLKYGVIVLDSKSQIIYFDGEKFVKTQYQKNINADIIDYHVTSGGVFFENVNKLESLQDADAQTIHNIDDNFYANYSYQFFSFKNNKLHDVELENGFSYASAYKVEGTDYFYFFEQKVKSDGTRTLSDDGVIVYFDNDLNKIIKYASNVNNLNPIMSYMNNNLLTKLSILTSNNSIDGVSYIEFESLYDNFSVPDYNINQSFFILESNNDSFVVDMNGNKIYSDAFERIYVYDKFNVIAQNDIGVYLLNPIEKSKIEIKNIVFDSDGYAEQLLFNGYGLFFIQNNNGFSLMSYESLEKPLLDNISSYSFINNEDRSFIKIVIDDKENFVFLKKSLDNNGIGFSNLDYGSNDVVTYADKKVSTVTGTNCSVSISSNGSFASLDFSMDNYYRITYFKLNFTVDGSEDAYCSWNMRYSDEGDKVEYSYSSMSRRGVDLSDIYNRQSEDNKKITFTINVNCTLKKNNGKLRPIGQFDGKETNSLTSSYTYVNVTTCYSNAGEDFCERTNSYTSKEGAAAPNSNDKLYLTSGIGTIIGGKFVGFSKIYKSAQSNKINHSVVFDYDNNAKEIESYDSRPYVHGYDPGNSDLDKNTEFHTNGDWFTYAVYEPITYNIQFDFNNGGGTFENNSVAGGDEYVIGGDGKSGFIQNIDYDELIEIEKNPTKSGYIFKGWNISNMGENSKKYYSASSFSTSNLSSVSRISTTSASNVTAKYFMALSENQNATVVFTPVWEAATYKIRLNIGWSGKDGNGNAIFNGLIKEKSGETYIYKSGKISSNESIDYIVTENLKDVSYSIKKVSDDIFALTNAGDDFVFSFNDNINVNSLVDQYYTGIDSSGLPWRHALSKNNINVSYTDGFVFDQWLVLDDYNHYVPALEITTNLAEYLGTSKIINYYAAYTRKPYHVEYNTNNLKAYGSTQMDPDKIINTQHQGVSDVVWKVNNFVPVTGEKKYEGYLSQDAAVTATLSGTETYQPYIFEKVVISDFGVKLFDGSYVLATIEIEFLEIDAEANATNSSIPYIESWAYYMSGETRHLLNLYSFRDTGYYFLFDFGDECICDENCPISLPQCYKCERCSNMVNVRRTMEDYDDVFAYAEETNQHQFFTFNYSLPSKGSSGFSQQFSLTVYDCVYTSDGEGNFSQTTIEDSSCYGFKVEAHVVPNHYNADDVIQDCGVGVTFGHNVQPIVFIGGKYYVNLYHSSNGNVRVEVQNLKAEAEYSGFYRYDDENNLLTKITSSSSIYSNPVDYWNDFLTNLGRNIGADYYIYVDAVNLLAYYEGRVMYNPDETNTQKDGVFRVNAYNTQVSALIPYQSYLTNSLNAENSHTTTRYELDTYLRLLSIGSSQITFNVIKHFDPGTNKYGDEISFTIASYTGMDGDISTIDESEEISYLGKVFKSINHFRFTTNHSSFKRTFDLFITREKSSSTSQNLIAYFLFSTVGNETQHVRIQANFENFEFDLETSVSRNGLDSYGDAEDMGATIYKFTNKVNGTGTDVTNISPFTTFDPSDTMILKITPNDGYLIKSLEISLYNTIHGANPQVNPISMPIYLFTLQNLDLYKSGLNANSWFTYTYTNLGISAETQIGLRYGTNPYSVVNTYTDSNEYASYRYGVYTSFDSKKNWITSSTNDYMAESFYILISGIYSNVSVKVQTTSYVEFDFDTSSTTITELFGISRVSSKPVGTSDKLGNNICDGSVNYSLKDLTKLSIVVKIGSNDVLLGETYDATYAVYDTEEGFFRIIFLGKANYFANGFKIFATGNDYSSYFTNGKLYGKDETDNSSADASGVSQGTLNASNASAFRGLERYEGRTKNGAKLLTALYSSDYLTLVGVDNMTEYFAKSHAPNEIGGTREYYMTARKYLIALTPVKNVVNATMHSYLYNGVLTSDDGRKPLDADYGPIQFLNGQGTDPLTNKFFVDEANNTSWKIFSGSSTAGYQLDSKYKLNSWFNDTILTNIDFAYFQSIDVNSTAKNINWQDNFVKNGTVQTDDILTQSNVYGYELTYTYYDIPGYYLQFIDVKTKDFGVLTLVLNASTLTALNPTTSGKFKGDSNYYYSLTYEAENSRYIFKLYRDVDLAEDVNRSANLDSLGIMSNDFDVSFYSMAYLINVSYNNNAYDGNISSSNEIKWLDSNGDEVGNGKSYLANQVIYYDTFSMLSYYMEMPGYTFLGWGSEKYYSADGTTPYRYSYSSGQNIWSTQSSWAAINSYFDNDLRESVLLMLKDTPSSSIFSYDFYVKSSDERNRNKTGYFITDTGNSQSENYNFWLTYYKEFMKNIGDTLNTNIINNRLSVDLFGVWRANTYAVEFKTYDFKEENGTTTAAFKKDSSDIDKYDWLKVSPNGLSIKDQNNNTITYYCFIVFDTNNWYIVDAEAVKGKKGSELFSYKADGSTQFLFNMNKLDFIVDRYGYSWLGWVSQSPETTVFKNLKQDLISINADGVITSDGGFTSSYMIYASDFYYELTSTSSSTRTMPTFNLSLRNKFDPIIEVYSEFVYAGEEYYTDEYTKNGKLYVCHYNYYADTDTITDISLNLDYYYSMDYTFSNKKSDIVTSRIDSFKDIAIGMYFDTSLPYENYIVATDGSKTVSIVREQKANDGQLLLKGKKIQLFALWMMNKYTYVVDVRDEDTIESTDSFGSTNVTNVTVQDNEIVFGSAYFDDNIESANIDETDELHYRLSNYIPTRVGYDFLGWTYYFNFTNLNPKAIDLDYVTGTTPGLGSDYADYIGQVIPANYTLNQSLLNVYTDCKVLYSSKTLNNSVNNLINDNNDEKERIFKNAQEVYGDTEGGKHFVYIYALWKEQVYTFNVSLNIKQEDLINAYDTDSQYAIGFYNRLLENDPESGEEVETFNTYTGIKQSFIKEGVKFTDIPANLLFEIKFDDTFENATFKIRVKVGTEFVYRKYKVKDLFAVSAGYYLLGWMIESGNPETIMIANSLLTTFGKDGNLLNNNPSGSSIFGTNDEPVVFNEEMFYRLKNSNYVQGSNGVAVNSLSNIDGAGTSTNFAMLTAYGSEYKYYIQTEPVVDGLSVVDYRLIFRYFGTKYYVKMYYLDDNSVPVFLDNDDSFLYFKESNTSDTKYVIRFDESGKAYYVDNDYSTKHFVNIMIAVFATSDGANIDTEENLFSAGADSLYTFEYKEDQYVNLYFTPKTTRQFTLYAHWQIKSDLYTQLINGNNNNEADGEIADSSSNLGLAGFYQFDNGTMTGDQCDEKIAKQYNFYDDVAFEAIPYYNGRYISEVKLDIWKLEENQKLTNDEFVTSSFTNVKYTLTIKFAWNSETNFIDIVNTNISTYNVANGINQDYTLTYSDKNLGTTAIDFKKIFTILDKGELTDANISSQEQRYNVLTAYDYATEGDTYFNRIDVNKISFDFTNVMTHVDVTFKISVQTYNVAFYGVMDDNGNTVKPVAGATNTFSVGFNSEEFNKNVMTTSTIYPEQYDKNDSSSAKMYAETNIATIKQDCASTAEASYNVPYGYFIYGVYYTSDVPPNRAIDATIGGIIDTDNNFGDSYHDYYGFSYIYSHGYYYYGSRSDAKLVKNGADDYYSQGSPLLGSTASFAQAKAVRLNLSFYTFRGWFEYAGTAANGNVLLNEYNNVRESSYINRNIVLYGYYYAINKPTSLTFYTWDDSTASYIEYPGNKDEYTLTSNSTTISYTPDNNILKPNAAADISQIVDNNGLAMIRYNKQYGVNGTEFNNEFSTNEIKAGTGADTEPLRFLSNILRTYWYYQESYDVLYFVDDDLEVRYLHYGTYDGENGFYYINSSSQVVRVIVNTPDVTNFTIKEVGSDWETPTTGEVINAYTETFYKYNFRGANHYIEVKYNDIYNYYQMHELSKDELTSYYEGLGRSIPAKLKTTISGGDWDCTYRFYVDIEGVRYYASNKYTSTSGYSISLYDENGVIANNIGSSYKFTTLNNYYIIYDDVYHTVSYKTETDDGGSEYINPFTKPSTVVLDGVTYYFNYQTEYLYKDYDEVDLFGNNNIYSERVEMDYKTYSPVNDNYEVKTTNDGGYWKISGVTVKSLPEPSYGDWINDEQCQLIGYINFTDDDLENLKSSGEAVGGEGTPPANSEDDQGGLIYKEMMEYVNFNYSTRDEVFISNLKTIIGVKIFEYEFEEDFLSNPLFVHSYIYGKTEYDKSTATGVNVYIPVEFSELEVQDASGNIEIVSISVVVVKKFDLITSATSVDTNIHAIPVYSRFVMEFERSAPTPTTDTTKFGVDIDTSKMNVGHFEVKNGATHVYNRLNGDFVRFVVLNKDQFNYIKDNKNDIGNYFNILFKGQFNDPQIFVDYPRIKEPLNVWIQPNEDAASQTISLDLSGYEAGEYFVFAFYYQSGSTSHIVRVSDNFINLMLIKSGETHSTTATLRSFSNYA